MCGSCLNKCISVALGPPKQKFLAPPLHAPLLSTPISSTLMSTMHLVIITILMTAKLLELSLIRDMRTTQW